MLKNMNLEKEIRFHAVLGIPFGSNRIKSYKGIIKKVQELSDQTISYGLYAKIFLIYVELIEKFKYMADNFQCEKRSKKFQSLMNMLIAHFREMKHQLKKMPFYIYAQQADGQYTKSKLKICDLVIWRSRDSLKYIPYGADFSFCNIMFGQKVNYETTFCKDVRYITLKCNVQSNIRREMILHRHQHLVKSLRPSIVVSLTKSNTNRLPNIVRRNMYNNKRALKCVAKSKPWSNIQHNHDKNFINRIYSLYEKKLMWELQNRDDEFMRLLKDDRYRLLQEVKPHIMEDITVPLRVWFTKYYIHGEVVRLPQVVQNGIIIIVFDKTRKKKTLNELLREVNLNDAKTLYNIFNGRANYNVRGNMIDSLDETKRRLLTQIRTIYLQRAHRLKRIKGFNQIPMRYSTYRNQTNLHAAIWLHYIKDFQVVLEYLQSYESLAFVGTSDFPRALRELRTLVGEFFRSMAQYPSYIEPIDILVNQLLAQFRHCSDGNV